MPRMPTRRRPVEGSDLDGRPISLSVVVARKLYVCPGCRGSLEIGTEHVLVRRSGRDAFHQHWHTDCAVPLAREIELAAERRS